MSVHVRFAIDADLPWLLGQLEKFSKMYSEEVSLFGADPEYRVAVLRRYIADHIFLVAEREASAEPVGLICGVLVPHHFNPTVKVLSEQFFWVAEEARESRVGHRLVTEFLRMGRELVPGGQITFSRLSNSPIKRETIESWGFSLKEESYVMTVPLSEGEA